MLLYELQSGGNKLLGEKNECSRNQEVFLPSNLAALLWYEFKQASPSGQLQSYTAREAVFFISAYGTGNWNYVCNVLLLAKTDFWTWAYSVWPIWTDQPTDCH